MEEGEPGTGLPERERMGGSRIRSKVRETIHLLATLFFWCLFGYWWGKVLPQTSAQDVFDALLLISLSILCTVVLTLVWVRHNIRIFRRKGPRKGLPSVSEHCSVDRTGVPVVCPGAESLKHSRVVTISRQEDRKLFHVAPGS